MDGRDAEDGVAAIELVFVFVLVLVIALIAFPLADTFVTKERLQRAADETVRFASSAPNNPAYGASLRRPTAADVVTAAQAAAGRDSLAHSTSTKYLAVSVAYYACDAGFDPSSCTTPVSYTNLDSGDMVRVSLTYCQTLGPFASIFSGARSFSSTDPTPGSGTCPSGFQTLTATATAREE